MPSEKFEKVLVLKHINKMEGDITQNNSRAELVRSSEESNETSTQSERTIKDVKFREWVMVLILCFVNLINYMDRFTLAGNFLSYLFTNLFIKSLCNCILSHFFGYIYFF